MEAIVQSMVLFSQTLFWKPLWKATEKHWGFWTEMDVCAGAPSVMLEEVPALPIQEVYGGYIPWPESMCPWKICMLKSNAQCDIWGGAFWRGLNYEGKLLGKEWVSSPFPPCEDTERRQPSVNQETGCYLTANLPAPWSWSCHPPELWETRVSCL